MIKSVGLRAVNKKKKEDIRVVTGMEYVGKENIQGKNNLPGVQDRKTGLSG
jgi:hypothetical protein